ncbi:putative uncharacterized protein [Prevotella sp. CAG:755]|nr:putative uncharacterized protein [Prevotella sp. CAG:755]
MEDDVAREDVVVFLDVVAHVGDELLDALHEVRVDVSHHAADRVVVQDEASAASLFEDVEDLFAVAEAVEEGRSGAEVLAEARKVEDVRVDSLQLIHDGADVLYALADFYAHSLFDAHAERVAVLHGAEVVQTVGQGQCLGVGEAFVEFFDAAVDVAEDGVDFADALAFKVDAEVEHTVGRGVLRSDVDDVIVVAEDFCLRAAERAVGVERVAGGLVGERLVGHAQRIVLFRIVVLAEGESHPVFAHVDAAQVGVTGEDDAIEVVGFALVDVGDVPKVADAWDDGALAVGCRRFQGYLFACRGRHELVDDAQAALFTPVHADEVFKEVHAFFAAQAFHLGAQQLGGDKARFAQVLGRFCRLGRSGGACRCGFGCGSGSWFSGRCGCGLGARAGRLFRGLVVVFHHAFSSSFTIAVSFSITDLRLMGSFSLRLVVPKKFSTFTLRCNCIMP